MRLALLLCVLLAWTATGLCAKDVAGLLASIQQVLGQQSFSRTEDKVRRWSARSLRFQAQGGLLYIKDAYAGGADNATDGGFKTLRAYNGTVLYKVDPSQVSVAEPEVTEGPEGLAATIALVCRQDPCIAYKHMDEQHWTVGTRPEKPRTYGGADARAVINLPRGMDRDGVRRVYDELRTLFILLRQDAKN